MWTDLPKVPFASVWCLEYKTLNHSSTTRALAVGKQISNHLLNKTTSSALKKQSMRTDPI
jgi:hypothetical protein